MTQHLAKYKISYDVKDAVGNWERVEDSNSSQGYTINNAINKLKNLREDSNVKNVQLQDYKLVKREDIER